MPKFVFTWRFEVEPDRADYVDDDQWDPVSLEDALAVDLANMRRNPSLYAPPAGDDVVITGEVVR